MRYGDRRGAHRVLVGKPGGKGPLARCRRIGGRRKTKWLFKEYDEGHGLD
jgi:hypothetical protein